MSSSWGMQRRMREQSLSVREMHSGAVDASPTASSRASFGREALKRMAVAVGMAIFLAFVGAFGAEAIPPIPRYLLFIALSLVCFSLVAAVMMGAYRVPALMARPRLRQAVIVALIAPGTALAVWLIVGWALLGGPRPSRFPDYFLIASGVTLTVSVLSRLTFRGDPLAQRTAIGAPTSPNSVLFLERLKGADLYAVEAEDHYVRLYTSKGSSLVLFRLADAAAALEGHGGARVHRSWWVARAAVTGTARRGAQMVLKLQNGVEAPVSRSQATALRRAGWF